MSFRAPISEGTDDQRTSDEGKPSDEAPFCTDESVDGDAKRASIPPSSDLAEAGSSDPDAVVDTPAVALGFEAPSPTDTQRIHRRGDSGAPSVLTAESAGTTGDAPTREGELATRVSTRMDDTQRVYLGDVIPTSKPQENHVSEMEVDPVPSSAGDFDKLLEHLPAPPNVPPEPLSVRDIEEDLTNAEPEPLSGRDIELEITPKSGHPHNSDEEPLSLRDIEEDLTPDDVDPAAPQVAPLPLVARKHSIPPPLPERHERPGLSGPPLMPTMGDLPSELVDESLVRSMIDRLAASDYEGAFMAASTLLRKNPRMVDALQAAQIARSQLYHLYDERLGSRDRVPQFFVRTEELQLHPLDASSALVLSRIDGSRTIDDIIHCGILPKLDTLRILSELFLQGILGFDEHSSAED